ncbi:MAG: L-dopachrome tautomerase-related protein [Planctomycetota bacterium]
MKRGWTTGLGIALLGAGCALSPDPAKRNPNHLADVAPLRSAGAIEVVIELPRPPGNLAVAADGTVFFTFHPEADPDVHVARYRPGDATYTLFPDDAWQHERDDAPYFVTPLAVRIDAQGWVWVLDHGDYGSEPVSLSAFDPESGALLHRHVFSDDVAEWGSMLNDFVIDDAHRAIYIADPSPFEFDPAIVVYDLATETARRVLENHDSVLSVDHHVVVQGRFMKAFGLPLQIDVDSIALSPGGLELYYGPLAGPTLYRIPTVVLRDERLNAGAVEAFVEVYGPKPTTDGIVCGPGGNVFLTAVEEDALAVLDAEGRLSVLARDPELLAWADGVSVSADGAWLYASVSELHRAIGRDPETLSEHAPFRIVRVPLR